MKLITLTAALSLTCIASLPACADTLKLISGTPTSDSPVEIYPYNFSVNGASTLTPLMCLDYNREITVGEQWNVSKQGIPLDNSAASANYRADAWIYSQLGAYSTEDVQYAVWSIFDPTDVNKLSQFNATSQKLASQALSLTANASTLGTAFYGKYQIYLPTADQTGWTNGIPQDFIGAATTPEPTSLALLGTGALGMAGVLRLRRKSQLLDEQELGQPAI